MAAAILALVGLVALRGPWTDRIPEGAVVVPRDVATVQDALTHAAPGDVIIVQASESPVQGPLEIAIPQVTLAAVGGRVRLDSKGADPALTIAAEGVIVRDLEITTESIGIHIQAADGRLENLTIREAPVAIQLTTASRCVLRSIDISGGDVGIDIVQSTGVDGRAIAISETSQYGIRLREAHHIHLEDMKLLGNDVGIALEEGSTGNRILAGDIRDCRIAGIEVRSSNDNAVRDCDLSTCRVGVLLEGVTGVEIEGCVIERSSVSGVMLQQSVQNRIVETRIDGSGIHGVQLSQSAENAVLYNEIQDCAEDGIHLVSSDKNLVLGNHVRGCANGLVADGSDDLRVLRNRVATSTVAGILISDGRSCCLFDNECSGGAFGIVLTACAETKALRNAVDSAGSAALSTIDSRGGNQLSENVARVSTRGALIVGSARDLWAYNRMEDGDIGCLLVGIGSGLRIEGNTFDDNRISLEYQPETAWLNDELSGLGIASVTAFDALPLLANNVFLASSDADIQNAGVLPLPAAGNWWGSDIERDPSAATIIGNVSLDTSAWKGSVAVGSGADDVSLVLGRILQMMLESEGYRVIDLVGMGPSDRLQQALLDADVDLIWWDGIASDDAAASTGDVGELVVPTGASDGWRIVISSELANQFDERTVSGLGAWCEATGEDLRYAATASLGDEAFEAFTDAYALRDSVRSFTPSDSLSEVEALLKFGAVDVAIVRGLEETLTLSGFIALDDDHGVLKQRAISMVVNPGLVDELPGVQDALSGLAERLTESVLHDLISRVRLLRKEPEDVAEEFLAALHD